MHDIWNDLGLQEMDDGVVVSGCISDSFDEGWHRPTDNSESEGSDSGSASGRSVTSVTSSVDREGKGSNRRKGNHCLTGSPGRGRRAHGAFW